MGNLNSNGNASHISKANSHLSSQITAHKQRPEHLKLGFQVLTWDMHTYMARINWLILLVFNISLCNVYGHVTNLFLVLLFLSNDKT